MKNLKLTQKQLSNPKWLALAAQMLKEASEEFSHHTCNDWDFPKGWTKKERQEFLKYLHQWEIDEGDTDDEEDGDRDWSVDFQVAGFLSECINQLAMRKTCKTK